MNSFLQYAFVLLVCLMPAGFSSAAQTQDNQAQSQLSQQAKANPADFRNIGEVYKFMSSYYRNPQPQMLVGALKTTLKSDLWKKASTADELQFACFFAFAGKSEPNIVEGYKNLFEPANGKNRLFVLRILHLCGNKDIEEYFRRELAAGRFINQKNQIEGVLETGMPMSFDTLSKLVGPANRVRLLWSEFAVTGRTETIEDLINSLAFEDPNLPEEDINDVREVAAKILKNLCDYNPDVMTICRNRLENTQGLIKSQIEEIIDSIDGSISAQRIIKRAPKPEILTGPKGWAIGCSAVLMERNHDRLDILATREIAKREIDDIRKSLDEWWGIKTKKELLDILSWLQTEGHRGKFDKVTSKVISLSDEQFKVVADTAKDDNDAWLELQVARKYGKQLGSKGILGWDYCRYINLCRMGYTIGLLNEQEAWDKIMPIARKLQSTFDSWEDFGCNYFVGFQFWSYEQTVKIGDDVEDAIQRLIDMPSSPWNKYPWNMDLGSREDVNDANKFDKS